METELLPISVSRGRHRSLNYVLEGPAGDHITRSLRRGNPYEKRVLTVMSRLQSRPGHFVDVGAHLGNHSVFMGMLGWRVTGFEPQDSIFRLFVNNLSRNGLAATCKAVPQAVSSAVQQLAPDGQPTEGNSGTARFRVDSDGPVPATSIDASGLSPDIMKIDVEGSEIDVLEGASATLDRCAPAIVIETHDLLDRVTAFLTSLGYSRMSSSLAGSPTYLFARRREHRIRWHLIRATRALR